MAPVLQVNVVNKCDKWLSMRLWRTDLLSWSSFPLQVGDARFKRSLSGTLRVSCLNCALKVLEENSLEVQK